MTAIEIINSGLADVGQNAISTLNDGTKAANLAKAKYPVLRDAVLEAREWTFAKSRIQLNRDVVVPVFGYSYQYVIPSALLRVVRVYQSGGLSPILLNDWVREGSRILTNQLDPIFAEVLFRADEGTFSPGMVEALSARCSAAFAIPLTENRQLAKDWMDNYKSLLVDAAAMDGSQGTMQQIRPVSLPGRRSHGL